MPAPYNTGGYRGLNLLQKKQVKKISSGYAKRSMEKKRYLTAGTQSAVLCGNAYMINPLYNLSQGTGVGNRVGSAIKLDNLKLKCEFMLGTSTINSGIIRMIVYLSDVESATSGSNPTQITNPNIQSTIPLLGNTTVNEVALEPVDWTQATVLYDKLFTLNANFGTTNFPLASKDITINFKGRKFGYLSDSPSYMEGKNLYVAWIFDSPQGTVNSTAWGKFSYTGLATFRE